MSAEEILTEHVVDIHRIEADFRDAFERNQSSSSLSGVVNTYFLIKHLCRRDSASTTGTLGPDVEKKMLSKNKLRWSGTSLPCKKLLNTSNTKFFVNGSTWPTLRTVRFSSTRTHSTLASAFNPSTFMTQGELCMIILLKENMDGFYRGLCHVLLFAGPQPVVQKAFTVLWLHINNAFAKKKRHCKESHSNHSRYYDFSRHWFSCKRFQWHRLALSQPRQSQYYWWSVLWLCFAYASGPHTIVRTGSIPDNWADVCGFLKPPWLSTILESKQTRCFFVKLLVYDPMINVATLRHGVICISLIGTTSGIIKLMKMKTFASKNGLRVLDMELKNVISAMCWATTRSRPEFATTCAPWCCGYLCSHEVTWWAVSSQISLTQTWTAQRCENQMCSCSVNCRVNRTPACWDHWMIFRVLHYHPFSANQLRLEEILQATRNFSIRGLCHEVVG